MDQDLHTQLTHIQNLSAGAYRRAGEAHRLAGYCLALLIVSIGITYMGFWLRGGSPIGALAAPQKVELVTPKPTQAELCAASYDHWASTRKAYNRQMLKTLQDANYDPVLERDAWIKGCVVKMSASH